MCLSAADSAAYRPKNSDFRADFNRFYAEREKVKEAYGRDDIYGQWVEILKYRPVDGTGVQRRGHRAYQGQASVPIY